MSRKLDDILKEHGKVLDSAREEAKQKAEEEKRQIQVRALMEAERTIHKSLMYKVNELKRLRAECKKLSKVIRVLDGGLDNLSAIRKVDPHSYNVASAFLSGAGIDPEDK